MYEEKEMECQAKEETIQVSPCYTFNLFRISGI